MIDTADFKNGLNFEAEGNFYTVVWFQHHKPGKGGAMVRVKLKDLHTGSITERTFKSGVKFREVSLERIKKQYLYKEGDVYHFMDLDTFDQIELRPDMIGENANFLIDDMEVEFLLLEDKIIGLQLPSSVILKVVYTEPGMKGDTVNNVMKPAELHTGAKIKVPLFVNIGDKIKVDTRTGEYLERVQ